MLSFNGFLYPPCVFRYINVILSYVEYLYETTDFCNRTYYGKISLCTISLGEKVSGCRGPKNLSVDYRNFCFGQISFRFISVWSELAEVSFSCNLNLYFGRYFVSFCRPKALAKVSFRKLKFCRGFVSLRKLKFCWGFVSFRLVKILFRFFRSAKFAFRLILLLFKTRGTKECL